jgi:histidine triad (HIT) family protein
MALNPEQIKSLKEQLKSQIQHLPEDKKQEALAQIESLSPQALEAMLKQQKGKGKEESVFRLIIEGKIPSAIINENTSALAVLEINPISKGHILIIPKKAAKNSKDIPVQALALAKSLSNKIISKLKAQTTEIQTETKFGEMIINIIPVYDKPVNLNSQRHKASKEELDEIGGKLKVKKKPKIERIKKEKKSSENQVLKLPRKIP